MMLWLAPLLLAPLMLDTEGARPVPVVLAGVAIVLGCVLAITRPALSLAVATALGVFIAVDGVSPAAPLIAAAVLSLLAGRRLERLTPAEYAFAAGAAAGLPMAWGQGLLGAWLSVLLTQFCTAVLPWWAGTWWRQRAELARAGWERAEQAAERARLRERARIAQDMHDTLGHELSLMALVAGGLELAPDLPGQHRETVARLRAGAVAATERLHEVIGLLGEAGPPDDDIGAVVARVRESGVRVTLSESGAGETPWAPAQRHAARRVVQEALTNAVKHAPGAGISVRVEHAPDEAVVSVRNTAPPAGPGTAVPQGRGGVGLISLHERVRLAGGTLLAGPADGGGFEVVARLPRSAPPLGPDDEAEADSGDGGDGAERIPGELREARERLQGRMLRSAALPMAVGCALVTLLVGAYVITVVTTSLEPAEFERLRIGQHRSELTELPASTIERPPPRYDEPPVPAGADDCDYYRAGSRVLNLSLSMYRLCFEDGVLVAKDTLHG